MKRATLLTIIAAIFLFAFACSKPSQQETEPQSKIAERVLVESKRLIPEHFEHHVTINGAVEAVFEAFVSPETNGQVKKIHVKEGVRVKKGDLLVSLNADAIRSGIDEVKSGLQLAQTVYERRNELWQKNIGSEIQYLEAKTNKESLENRLKSLQAQLALSEIKAPITGIVEKIHRKEGELAMPGMELIRLINLNRVRINAELAETYLNRIKEGDEVEVTYPTYPGRRDAATINRVSQSVNPKNRTVLVVVELDNPDESVKPNMMASVTLNDYVDEEALLVPSIIVKNDMEGRYVYLIEGTGEAAIARKTYIEIGLSEAGVTQVIKGVQAGQEVIVVGYNQVSNGTAIRKE